MSAVRSRLEHMTELELRILDFEATHHHPAGKERAVRELFGVSMVRYFQILWAAIDRPDADELRPMVVKRLRRIREQGVQRRLGRMH